MTQKYIRLLILVVVVVLAALYIVWPNSPGIPLGKNKKTFTTQLGLDLVGGAQALLEADLPSGATIDAESMATAANIVENRVNGLGVTEAVVQRAGERRILVELPGASDPEKVLATLQQTGLLEFVDFSNISAQEALAMEESQTAITTDYGMPTSTITDTGSLTSTASLTTTFHTVMTGSDLKTVTVGQGQTGGYQIAFELSASGAKIFKDFTSAHIGDPLAIVLDKKVISSPVIQNAITDGKGLISGSFTYESANALAIQLRYGSLPIPLKVVEIRTVGPTLGQDSLDNSLRAGLVGFAIIVLFMAIYYRLPGLIADLAILTFAAIAFAIFRFIPVTLTLPGIAGFMLSIGSALDANILIFERLKEELRNGRPLKQAIDLGWKRALPSIRDSNIATIITCVILFWFGSSFGATIVKGFSVTLLLGVLVSLFTALVVTRTLFELIFRRFKSTDYTKWFGI